MFFKNLHDPPEFTSFKVFQFLGYFIGGIGPVIIFLMFEMLGMDQNIIDGKYISSFMFFALLGAIIGFIAFYIEHSYSEKHILFKIFFLTQAIFSILLIHFLVLYSGGPKSSVFALSYLYIPAVVGFTYGKGINLTGAVIALCISYILCLFWLTEQQDMFKSVVVSGKEFVRISPKPIGFLWNNSDKWIYFIVFLIQIMVTKAIASKRKEKNKINLNLETTAENDKKNDYDNSK